MGQNEALHGTPAIDKFKEVVDHNAICMFLTRLDQRPIPSRPMAVQKVCDQGNFWFLSSRSSTKDQQVKSDPQVQLVFSNPSRSEFLSVLGHAEEIDDHAKKAELWTPLAKAWFPNGVEDPDLIVIKVKPVEGHYWDTRDGRAISMLKIVSAAITGKPSDGGVQGKISVN